MSQNNICIVCGIPSLTDVWNDLSVYVCPNCFLGWRTNFDLSKDYYQTVEVDNSAEKKIKRQRNTDDQIDLIKKYLPRSNVWDLGAGDGTFLLSLKNHGYANCVGVEPGENGLEIAAKRNITIERGVISDLPVLTKGKKVSAITMFHLIEHLSNPKESLSVIRNSLTEQGILVIETPNAQAPIQSITNHRNHLVYPEHLFYWTEQSLRSLLEQTGFKVLKVKYRSFDWKYAAINNSLLRLGLRRADNGINKDKPMGREISNKNHEKNNINSTFRSFIRTLLALAVRILKKDDYILIVARCNSKL